MATKDNFSPQQPKPGRRLSHTAQEIRDTDAHALRDIPVHDGRTFTGDAFPHADATPEPGPHERKVGNRPLGTRE